MRVRGISPKTATDNAMTISVAEKVENTSLVGDNRACSNGESRKDRRGDGMSTIEGSVCSKEPICHGRG